MLKIILKELIILLGIVNIGILKDVKTYLPKDYELLYTQDRLLMSKAYGVDQAIKNVPENLKMMLD